ncbi:MAG: hypothetical protein ABJD07_01510, partial [Gemmatimonadaceae bacterium]
FASGVTALGRDTLALRPLHVTGDVAVPLASLTRLEVKRGSHANALSVIAGVTFGALGGALLGVFVGPVIECGGSCSGRGEFAGLGGALGGLALGGLAGAIGGGILGSHSRVPNWAPVPLPLPER